jgi:hypothetical protein
MVPATPLVLSGEFLCRVGLRHHLIASPIALFKLQNLHALEIFTQSKPNQLGPIRSPVAGRLSFVSITTRIIST